MSSLSPKDRASLCSFTFSDGRRCRTPRVRNHPHFCFYHAQKEARARAAESLGKDLAYFFSGNYLSACDLSTAMARLIPAVVRGDVKSRTAHTVAYLAQTLMQAIHISQHEYINAFGTDGWRKSIRNSVNGNYDYRFPPVPAPLAPAPEQPAHVTPVPHPFSDEPSPAASQPQPAQSPVNCHSGPSDERPTSCANPESSGEESASSSNSSLATRHSSLPPASQSEIPALSGPAPSTYAPLPPTSADFVQHVLAGLPQLLRCDLVGQTGVGEPPLPAEIQVSCHSGPSDERPTKCASPESSREESAFSASPACHPERSAPSALRTNLRSDRRFRPCRKGSHPIPSPASAPPTSQPTNPPPTLSPSPKPVLALDSRALHYDHNSRLRIDGKPF